MPSVHTESAVKFCYFLSGSAQTQIPSPYYTQRGERRADDVLSFRFTDRL
ncbi:hypothetical protein PMCN06_0777 [Pasteurella multocida subsp. multocida str. HN06]|nr:hypothetical protein PMCN06_0777 [Pasteurella multocida subsp. multocida str. HN06]